MAPEPNVANPSPCLVNPPAPEIAAVRLSDPEAEVEAVPLTMAVRESTRMVGAEMVLFPVAPPMVVIVAGPAPAASKVSDPPVPAVSELLKVPRSLLKRIDPTVCGPSRVIVRLAVCAGFEAVAAPLKIAIAPTPLGTLAGFQFAGVFQLPPVGRFHTSACADRPLVIKAAAQNSPKGMKMPCDRTARGVGDEQIFIDLE